MDLKRLMTLFAILGASLIAVPACDSPYEERREERAEEIEEAADEVADELEGAPEERAEEIEEAADRVE